MKPIERLVMHAGKLSGMSLDQVNGMLTESGLKPVTAGNWRFVERYRALTSRNPSALGTLTFGAIPLQRLHQMTDAPKPGTASPRTRFRVVRGGKR